MGPKESEIEKVFDEVGELRQIRKSLEKKNGHWTDNFRIITPIALAILGYFMTGLSDNFKRLDLDVRDMRTEVQHHLQNSEIHIPRASVVSLDAFTIYQTMRDKQMSDLACSLARIENILDKERK
jgi:hypothetical protein